MSEPSQAPTALLMVDIGTPSGADDVLPFLARVYGDSRALASPFGGDLHGLFASFKARLRAPALRRAVSAVGPAPERAGMEALARDVAASLASDGAPFRGYVGLRHASPTLAEALALIEADGCRRVVALHARPFASRAGSESIRAELARLGVERPALDISLLERCDDEPSLRALWGELIQQALESVAANERTAAHLLFLLQAQPIEGRQDPALERMRAAGAAVLEGLGSGLSWSVGYLDAIDPTAPLTPTAREELERVAREKKRTVVAVCAFHFCETLAARFELDGALAESARALGIAQLVRAPALASRPQLPRALAGFVKAHLAQGQAVRSSG